MSLPGLSATGSGVVVLVALAQTTRLFACGGETSGLAVLSPTLAYTTLETTNIAVIVVRTL